MEIFLGSNIGLIMVVFKSLSPKLDTCSYVWLCSLMHVYMQGHSELWMMKVTMLKENISTFMHATMHTYA